MQFVNRVDAGRRLGARLAPRGLERPVVVGVLRGGVPVAVEVARALGAPMDVAVVRKIGAPGHPEYALGAIGEGGAALVDRTAQRRLGVSDAALQRVVDAEYAELDRRSRVYRAKCPRVEVVGRTAVLVDDGLATGATASAAARDLKARGARRVVLAVPVCAGSSVDRPPDRSIDEVISLWAPHELRSVGEWYEDFSQVEDQEVLAALEQARVLADAPARGVRRFAVEIETTDGILLPGTLVVPAEPRGVIAFAHGSGSSRRSPRNQMVAEVLQRGRFATLLFDLLEPREAADRANVFNIPLLGARLVAAVEFLTRHEDVEGLPVGLFGASTGGGAALWAAAELGDRIGAVVARGGRPDLAGPRLPDVLAPTLLLVGGDDRHVIELNRAAMARLRCAVSLRIVAGAGHLFEEPGALEQVAAEARDWFAGHLVHEGQHVVR